MQMPTHPSVILPSSSSSKGSEGRKTETTSHLALKSAVLVGVASAVAGAVLTFAGSRLWSTFKRWNEPVGHKSVGLTDELHTYLVAHTARENESSYLKKLQVGFAPVHEK
jgi:hypothetical protein